MPRYSNKVLTSDKPAKELFDGDGERQRDFDDDAVGAIGAFITAGLRSGSGVYANVSQRSGVLSLKVYSDGDTLYGEITPGDDAFEKLHKASKSLGCEREFLQFVRTWRRGGAETGQEARKTSARGKGAGLGETEP